LSNNGKTFVSSSFTQYYSKEQFVYQRYDNSKFNTFNDATYFTGSFLPLPLFFNNIKPVQDTYSLIDIAKNYYEINENNLINNNK
jgi:hypothetical protein